MAKSKKSDKKDKKSKKEKKLAKLVKGGDDAAVAIPDKLRVDPETFHLADVDASATPGFKGDEAGAEDIMAASRDEIDDLQERLYANGRDGDGPAVLLVVQGMDTSGKGGIMRHVVGLFDPQGVTLHAFKAPTAQEKKHPFLWRIRQHLPAPGMIGVFDRSQYEDVLVVRVHNLVPPATWARRYGQINTFEETATKRGIHVVKVMLHISADEQKARLQARLDRSDKWWKFNPGDIDERESWEAYMEAYDVALAKTSMPGAPWYCVPADNKWYARLAVQQIMLAELRGLGLNWPTAEFDVDEQKARLASS